mgnify:CR=1 FL=1
MDARDPLSCRCKNIERKILGMPDKKIILVLNKIENPESTVLLKMIIFLIQKYILHNLKII